MSGLFPSHGPSAFDAITSALAAGLFLLVGLAALVYAPRDARTRVFCVNAIASVAPCTAATYAWLRGADAALARPVVAAVVVSLVVGSVALLHFMQVFPWRRPWVRRHAAWLAAAYVALPVAAFVLIARGPAIDVSATSNIVDAYVQIPTSAIVLLLLVAMPLLVLAGVVIPLAGLLSLYKSWIAAGRNHIESARVTTLWMLISQFAGGVLTILVIPLLDLIAPPGWWTIAAASLLFAFGLLMPIAFALGIWRWRVLDINVDSAPAGL